MSRRPAKSTRLPPNVYRRGDTLWGRIQVGGRELRRSLRTDDAEEAGRRVAAWRAELQQEADGTASERWDVAVGRWIAEVLPEAVKPSVSRRYQVSIAQMHDHFHPLRIDQITTRTIGDYISTRSGIVSNATIRRDLTALSRLLACCIAWGWLEHNPARAYDRSVVRERKTVFQPPTPAELETLLGYASPGVVRLLRFLDQTGMRMMEAVGLEWRHVDKGRRQITLVNTKSSRPRSLPYSTPGGDAGLVLDKVVPLLRSPLVFRNRDQAQYGNLSGNFQEIMGRAVYGEAAAGRTLRRFRIHDLRHGFAIRWLQNGGGIYDLSRHLGHTSVSTTEIYLRYLTTEQEQAAKQAGTKTGTAGTSDEAGKMQRKPVKR